MTPEEVNFTARTVIYVFFALIGGYIGGRVTEHRRQRLMDSENALHARRERERLEKLDFLREHTNRWRNLEVRIEKLEADERLSAKMRA